MIKKISFLVWLFFSMISVVYSQQRKAVPQSFADLLLKLSNTVTQKKVTFADISLQLAERQALCRQEEKADNSLPELAEEYAYEIIRYSKEDTTSLNAIFMDSIYFCQRSFILPSIAFNKKSRSKASVSITFEEIGSSWESPNDRPSNDSGYIRWLSYVDINRRFGKPVSIQKAIHGYFVSYNYQNKMTKKKVEIMVASDFKPWATKNTIHSITIMAY